MKRMIKYKYRHNFQKKRYYKYRNNAKKIRKRILVPKTPKNIKIMLHCVKKGDIIQIRERFDRDINFNFIIFIKMINFLDINIKTLFLC